MSDPKLTYDELNAWCTKLHEENLRLEEENKRLKNELKQVTSKLDSER